MNLLVLQLLVCLGTAHVLGDFLFQSDRVAQGKRDLGVLLMHALTVALLSYLLCSVWQSWLIPAAVFVSHAVVDAIKARVPRRDLISFLADQLAHGVTIMFIAFAAARPGLSLFGVKALGSLYLQALLLVAGLVLSLVAGGVLISLAVEPLLKELKPAAPESGSPRPEPNRGFKHGGRLIGQLERGLIFLFILTGQPASIGFLIAAKSVFRFGELKEHRNRMEAEYIIIGTMMSFGFGLLIAYLTRLLLGFEWA